MADSTSNVLIKLIPFSLSEQLSFIKLYRDGYRTKHLVRRLLDTMSDESLYNRAKQEYPNVNVEPCILPMTVSPTANVPEVILISSSFGVVKLVTSILSKNA